MNFLPIDHQRQQFLRLACVEMLTYKVIAARLGVEQSQLSSWWEELRAEREALTSLRNLYNRKRSAEGFASFAAFHDWYLALPQQCYYCGISPAQIEAMRAADQIHTKRWATRGRRLELDRLDPEGAYNADNVVLCCYWCNNAKTDEFSPAAFRAIAAGIRAEWDRRLALLPAQAYSY
jgi:5-methylcytosine-specific restriction endonuclease McrA